MFSGIRKRWQGFYERHTTLAQFIMFLIISNGMTVLQLILMPVFKWLFGMTSLVDTTFQWLQLGDGFYMFDYPAGAIPVGGGGLAYFLAVQITILIAQVINFFAQRNVTFKSNSNIWWAAMWYAIAYVVITFAAALLQSFYKVPLYDFAMRTWPGAGETMADMLTMIINALVQFWVFFPIFKVIFRQVPEEGEKGEETSDVEAGPAKAN